MSSRKSCFNVDAIESAATNRSRNTYLRASIARSVQLARLPVSRCLSVQRLDPGNDLRGFRKPTLDLFGEQDTTRNRNVEDTAPTFNELHVHTER